MSQVGTSNQNGGNLPQFRSLAVIAIGSNASFREVDPTEVISSALYTLSGNGGVIRSKSAFYRSPAFPPGAGPDFVNAACILETSDPPETLLEILHEIEAAHGRERHVRWGPRTLDLDLIAYENQVFPNETVFRSWMDLPLDAQQAQAPEQLILPHPRMHERAFVLVPLAEIAPDWHHPVLNRTVSEMLKSLPKKAVEEVQIL